MREYFFKTKLATGEYVNIVYKSEYKKHTSNHWHDLCRIIYDNGIDVPKKELRWNRGWHRGNFWIFVLLNTERNRREECFDCRRTIDLRKEG